MEKTRILVVDDEEDICNATKNFLTKKGYEVFTALTRDEAIDTIRENRPAIIFLDIRLKEASGIDILKHVKLIDRNIKVIMVTALDDEETMKHVKAWGADDYITKPFTADYLNSVLIQKLTSIAIRSKKVQVME